MLLKRTSQFFCSTVCLGESSDLFLSKAGLEKNYRGLVWAKAAWSAETLAVDWWWISSCGERTGGCFQGIFVAWCKSAQCQWHFQLAQGLRKRRCFFFATENLEEIHMALWCFTCTDEAVCNRTAWRISEILARISYNSAYDQICIEAWPIRLYVARTSQFISFTGPNDVMFCLDSFLRLCASLPSSNLSCIEMANSSHHGIPLLSIFDAVLAKAWIHQTEKYKE